MPEDQITEPTEEKNKVSFKISISRIAVMTLMVSYLIISFVYPSTEYGILPGTILIASLIHLLFCFVEKQYSTVLSLVIAWVIFMGIVMFTIPM